MLVEVAEDGNVSSDNIARIRQLLASLREKLEASLATITDNGIHLS